MDDDDIPGWILGSARAIVTAVEPATKRVELAPQGIDGAIAFSQVPSGWTVVIRHLGAGYDHSLAVQRQAAGVRWELREVGPNEIQLPPSISAVSVWAAGQGLVRIWCHAQRAHLTLGAGHFEVSVGPDRSGILTVTEDTSLAAERKFELAGSARLARFKGTAVLGLVVHELARNADLGLIEGSVTCVSDPDGVAVVSRGDVSFQSAVHGQVRVEAVNITANAGACHGRMTARCIRVTGDLGTTEQMLELRISERLWVRGSANNLDVRCSRERDEKATIRLAFADETGPLEVDYGPLGSASDPQLTKPTTNYANRDAEITRVRVRGRADVEFGVAATACRVSIKGKFACVGNFSAFEPPKRAPILFANYVAISGVLDLAGGNAKVRSRLDAGAVSHGTLSEVNAGAQVVTGSLRGCSVSVSRVAVVGNGGENAVIEASRVETQESLVVHGTIGTGCTLAAAGDVALHGPCESPLSWTPGQAWDRETPKCLRLHADLVRLDFSGAAASDPPPEGRVFLAASIAELVVRRGTIRLTLDGAARDDVVGKLRLADHSTVEIAGNVGTLPRVEVGGEATLSTAGLQGPACLAIGLTSTTPGARINLEPGNKTISLVKAATSASAQTDDETCPLIYQSSGNLAINRSVPVVVSSATGTGVCIHLSEGRRVDLALGRFALGDLSGRLVGHRRGDSVPPGAPVESVATRVFGRASSERLNKTATGGDALARSEEAVGAAAKAGELIDIDISQLPPPDVSRLAEIHVVNPVARPLIEHAKSLARTDRGMSGAGHWDDVRAQAQKLDEISSLVRSRSNSGNAHSAARWAAAHAHALTVPKPGLERTLRSLHRLVGYGVRPGPALAAYLAWTSLMTTILWTWDSRGPAADTPTAIQPGPYGLWDSFARALLVPTSLLRADFGGAVPYSPIFEHPLAHFVAVLITSLVLGFLLVATKNFLVRPKQDV